MVYKTKKKAFDFCEGGDASLMFLCIAPLREIYMFSSITPKLYRSASFAVPRTSSLLFTFHALIFLKGHRHEGRTLLNIPAIRGLFLISKTLNLVRCWQNHQRFNTKIKSPTKLWFCCTTDLAQAQAETSPDFCALADAMLIGVC